MYRTVADAALIEAAQRIASLVRACRDGHHPFACSGVKTLRNTSAALAATPSCAKRFGPLTPSARSGKLIAGDGTKNGLPAPTNQKHHLTGRAPYKSANRRSLDASRRRGGGLSHER